jgi:dTDP-4-dehydrorhamnose 3,5-epimerase
LGDPRGSFSEVWRRSWTDEFVPGGFPQANRSRSARGVLRGMHVHLRQWDLWLVLDGRAFVCLVDLRDGDAPAPPLLTIDAEAGSQVLIPPLVAHGFLSLERMSLLYLVSNEYDGTDEGGFRWDDPEAAIPWPEPPAVISRRDHGAPSLAELRRTLAL